MRKSESELPAQAGSAEAHQPGVALICLQAVHVSIGEALGRPFYDL